MIRKYESADFSLVVNSEGDEQELKMEHRDNAYFVYGVNIISFKYNGVSSGCDMVAMPRETFKKLMSAAAHFGAEISGNDEDDCSVKPFSIWLDLKNLLFNKL